jgi:hypothetical protein
LPLILALVCGSLVALRVVRWLLTGLLFLPTIPVKLLVLGVRKPIWLVAIGLLGLGGWLLVAAGPQIPAGFRQSDQHAGNKEWVDIPLQELQHLDLLHSDWRTIRRKDGTARAHCEGSRLTIPLPDLVAPPRGGSGLFEARATRLVMPDRRLVKDGTGRWILEEGDWIERGLFR